MGRSVMDGTPAYLQIEYLERRVKELEEMMDDQYRHIEGYRELDFEEISLINQLKNLENAVLSTISSLQSNADTDKRWVAIGLTDIQKGFMALVRSVARPE